MFSNTLVTQAHSHYSIANCRDDIVARRQKVKEMSAERKAHIKASLAWQQFTRDADEVSNIMLCTIYV